MKTEQELTARIMRRVYATYALRQLSQPWVRFGALSALLLALRELVFVSKVVENASLKSNIFEFLNYGFSAFAGTEFFVQLTVLAVAFIAAVTVWDFVTSIRGGQTTYA